MKEKITIYLAQSCDRCKFSAYRKRKNTYYCKKHRLQVKAHWCCRFFCDFVYGEEKHPIAQS